MSFLTGASSRCGMSVPSFHWYPNGACPPRGLPILARMGTDAARETRFPLFPTAPLQQSWCRRGAGARRGVDRLGKRDEIRIALPEDLDELQELSCVPCKAGELGEDKAGDTPRRDVIEHPLGFGIVLHGLSRHRVEPIYLDNVPTLRLSVQSRSPFVVFRTLSPRTWSPVETRIQMPTCLPGAFRCSMIHLTCQR